MNSKIAHNFSLVKPYLLFIPLSLLVMIFLFLYHNNALTVDSYIQFQKNCFFFLNSKLSQYPLLIYNLTQFGDAWVPIALLSIFVIYAPKLWQALIPAALIAAVVTLCLKILFSVSRAAEVFDNHSFTIIGKAMRDHSSLPSGHSANVFTMLTVIFFAFLPKNIGYRILWGILLLAFGVLVALSRIGVGAHYPVDTIVGSVLGIFSGILGVVVVNRTKIFDWVGKKKYDPIFITIFAVCLIVLISKIVTENLLVFYVAVVALTLSLYKIISVYFKNKET